MRNRSFTLLVVFAGLLLASCSKKEDVIEPVTPVSSQKKVWVNYSHTVNENDMDVVYTIQYLSTAGVETITNHKGNFSVRVPVVALQENGNHYGRSMINIIPATNDAGEVTPMHSQLSIKTDHNFIIAQAGQTTYDCGYDARRLEEETPISWFSYKF